jgi:protein TonB
MTAVGMPSLRYTPSPEANDLLLAEELAELAERAQALTSAPGVMIALRRGNELVVRTSDGIAPEVGACIPFPSGVTGLCITSKRPQTSDGADVEAQLEASFRVLNVRSVLAVPIEHGGEMSGVLAVLSQAPAVFSRTHVAILMTLADVIGGKLAQYPRVSDVARNAVSGEVIDIDVQSLLRAAAPQANVAPPKLDAPTPPEAVAIAAQPAKTLALPRVAAVPVAATEKITPISPPSRSRPAATPLAAFLKETAESPVPTNPDVLSPAEDPMKHSSVVARPVVTPAIRSKAKAANVPPAMYTPYRTQKSERSHIPLFAACAAIVVLGVAAALYPHLRSAAPAATASAAAEPAHLTAVPISPAEVSVPKGGVEQPAAVATPAPASAASAPRDKEATAAAPQPKPAAETTISKPAPILQLASGQPKARAEQPVESPALALVGASGKALPDLPLVPAPAALAVNKPVVAVLVPATRVQGAPPQFPEEARRLGRSGVVKVLISISAEGKVTDARVLTGDLMLRNASITAVRGWIYTPARLDGKPVASTAEVSLRFNAER